MEEPRPQACLLTPPGAGALAVIAVRGSRAWPLLSPYFQPRRQPPVLQSLPTLTFGTLTAEGQGDEIVLLLQGDAHEQYLELQLHGGPGVITWCLRFLEDRGCTIVPWTDWVHDDAERLLPLAMTKRTASILLDQTRGAFAIRLRELEHEAARHQVYELLTWAHLGLHLVTPWKVLLAGPPNVGKSSLLNALAGYQRAITSATPGTTRDLVSTIVVCDGFPIEFVDSAGLRTSDDPLEQAGMERTHDAVGTADVVLWLVDGATPSIPSPGLNPTFTIGTKADLGHVHRSTTDFIVSAHTGVGVATLLQRVKQHLIPRDPSPGQIMPITPAQVERLRQLIAQ